MSTGFLTHDEAAAYLMCERVKFYRLRKEGHIRAYRHGGRLFFLKDDLDAYFLSLRATLPSSALEMPTKIYLMRDRRTGLTKIGRSKEPKVREKTLQSEAPLVDLLVYWDGVNGHERLLHDRFADKRVRGEWFDLTADDIAEITKGKDNRCPKLKN